MKQMMTLLMPARIQPSQQRLPTMMVEMMVKKHDK
jgi:hypothetical protein